jgi:shikimate kinase
MQRTIIALSGPRNAGKTTTIRRAYEQLSEEGNATDLKPKATKEITAIIEIDGVKIGFASEGDRPKELREKIKELIAAGCIVIVCATRNAGTKTYRVVSEFEPEYQIVRIEKSPSAQMDFSPGDKEKADEIIGQIRLAIEQAQLAVV